MIDETMHKRNLIHKQGAKNNQKISHYQQCRLGSFWSDVMEDDGLQTLANQFT